MSNLQFRRLEEAGIRVSYMMGNHDRRAGFLAVHPDYFWGGRGLF